MGSGAMSALRDRLIDWRDRPGYFERPAGAPPIVPAPPAAQDRKGPNWRTHRAAMRHERVMREERAARASQR